MWLTFLKFIRPIAPYLLCAGVVYFFYEKAYNEGKEAGYSKAIVETRKMIESMPDLKCEPCNGVTFDEKMRGKISLTINQSVTGNAADSIKDERFRKIIREELEKIPTVKCKGR